MNNNFLEAIYHKYNRKEFIETDPILFPHTVEGNTEFIAFTAASFAYGNVKAIKRFLYSYFESYGSDPLRLDLTSIKPNIYYRFQTAEDIYQYSLLMKRVYEEYGSLENLFKSAEANDIDKVSKAIVLLRSYLDNITQGLNFLMPIPGKSASKRLHMFIRWMVRCDEVDLGLWHYFDRACLKAIVDTHILRMARNLKIIEENEKASKAVEKITAYFLSLNPEDPAKYDFALTRLGIAYDCKYERNDKYPLCRSCDIYNICPF